MEIQQKISKANLAKKVGQTLEVIVGTRIARPPDNNSARPPDNNSRQIYIARSYGEAPDIDGVIFVHSKKSLNTGDFVHVKIKQASEYDLIGELYESAQ
jgi:ribosomal protein S12 methylthiotransferase